VELLVKHNDLWLIKMGRVLHHFPRLNHTFRAIQLTYKVSILTQINNKKLLTMYDRIKLYTICGQNYKVLDFITFALSVMLWNRTIEMIKTKNPNLPKNYLSTNPQH
jgi:hypothetical protein